MHERVSPRNSFDFERKKPE